MKCFKSNRLAYFEEIEKDLPEKKQGPVVFRGYPKVWWPQAKALLMPHVGEFWRLKEMGGNVAVGELNYLENMPEQLFLINKSVAAKSLWHFGAAELAIDVDTKTVEIRKAIFRKAYFEEIDRELPERGPEVLEIAGGPDTWEKVRDLLLPHCGEVWEFKRRGDSGPSIGKLFHRHEDSEYYESFHLLLDNGGTTDMLGSNTCAGPNTFTGPNTFIRIDTGHKTIAIDYDSIRKAYFEEIDRELPEPGPEVVEFRGAPQIWWPKAKDLLMPHVGEKGWRIFFVGGDSREGELIYRPMVRPFPEIFNIGTYHAAQADWSLTGCSLFIDVTAKTVEMRYQFSNPKTIKAYFEEVEDELPKQHWKWIGPEDISRELFQKILDPYVGQEFTLSEDFFKKSHRKYRGLLTKHKSPYSGLEYYMVGEAGHSSIHFRVGEGVTLEIDLINRHISKTIESTKKSSAYFQKPRLAYFEEIEADLPVPTNDFKLIRTFNNKTKSSSGKLLEERFGCMNWAMLSGARGIIELIVDKSITLFGVGNPVYYSPSLDLVVEDNGLFDSEDMKKMLDYLFENWKNLENSTRIPVSDILGH